VFKERKKKRKQEKKKRQDEGGDDGDYSPGALSRNNSSHEYDDENRGGVNGNNHAPALNDRSSHSIFKPENLSKEQDSVSKATGREDVEAKQPNTNASNSFRRQQSSPIPSRSPPGLEPSAGGTDTPNYNLNHNVPDPSTLNLNDFKQQNNQPAVMQHFSSGSSLIAPDARFIIVPRAEIPDPLPGEAHPSLAVPAARHFIASYYSYLENASPSFSIGDLAQYYTTKAQKSVSIGGAHSVVQGRKDITTQILSLAGSSFLVRGVVAQDAYDGHGVHILITGTAKTVCNAVAGGVLAFAHSVSLSPTNVTSMNGSAHPELRVAIESGYPYQIHNDALAFLSGDAIPQPAPPQQQRQPQPPPGMF
jgi:hypothetical protein